MKCDLSQDFVLLRTTCVKEGCKFCKRIAAVMMIALTGEILPKRVGLVIWSKWSSSTKVGLLQILQAKASATVTMITVFKDFPNF